MLSEKLNQISRRDVLKLVKKFGITSTMLAAGGLTGALSLPRLADAANSTYNKRLKKTPKFKLKFGAAGFTEQNLLIERAGCLQFVNDLEERTDGEIQIEFIGANQICGQLNCVKKTQQGIVDLYAASTQNSAGGAPYLNVLDYAYMFPTRASQYYFLYHPGSQKVLRDQMRKRHNIEFLFSHAELRGIQLGLAWKDKPLVTSVTQLAGSKNRVTGTQLGRIAMDLMELNPTPIAWAETLDGLKQGLIDGAETWAIGSGLRQHVAGGISGRQSRVLLRYRAHGHELQGIRQAWWRASGRGDGIRLPDTGSRPGRQRSCPGQHRRILGPAASEHDLRQARYACLDAVR